MRRLRLPFIVLVFIASLVLTPGMGTDAQIDDCESGCYVCRTHWIGDQFCDPANSENGYCTCFELSLLGHWVCNLSGTACFGVIVVG